MNVIYSPNKHIDTSFKKTNQNLERLTKLSSRLNDLHVKPFIFIIPKQLNIETEKFSKFEQLDLDLNYLETKEGELNSSQLKQFAQIKQQMVKIIKSIEEDRIKNEASFMNRAQYISTLEFKLLEKFEIESDLMNQMEKKFLSIIDEKYLILNSELRKEIKNKNEGIQNLNFMIETEIPKSISDLNTEKIFREESDFEISTKINQEFQRLFHCINS